MSGRGQPQQCIALCINQHLISTILESDIHVILDLPVEGPYLGLASSSHRSLDTEKGAKADASGARGAFVVGKPGCCVEDSGRAIYAAKVGCVEIADD